MAVIFALSSRSHLPSAPQPLLDLLLRKAAHFVEYGVLALLWLRALSPAQWRSARGPALAAFVIATLYAVSDELHQALVPGRHPQPTDVLIDAAGAAAAMLAGRLPWHAMAGRGRRSGVILRHMRELWREIRLRSSG
jgi:VanZ family protein